MSKNMKDNQYRSPLHSATFVLGYHWTSVCMLLMITNSNSSFPEKSYQNINRIFFSLILRRHR